MARPSKFTRDEILDAARSAIAEHGLRASVAQVSGAIGAPVGSIYHRFASRDALFVALWLRSIRRFQEGLFAAATIDDPQQALLTMARHVVSYCRDNPAEALAMTLYRQTELVGSAPPEMLGEVTTINDEIGAVMARLSARRFPNAADHHIALTVTAVQQCPYGLIRRHIGGPIPPWYDDAAEAAARAILAMGDQPGALV